MVDRVVDVLVDPRPTFAANSGQLKEGDNTCSRSPMQNFHLSWSDDLVVAYRCHADDYFVVGGRSVVAGHHHRFAAGLGLQDEADVTDFEH